MAAARWQLPLAVARRWVRRVLRLGTQPASGPYTTSGEGGIMVVQVHDNTARFRLQGDGGGTSCHGLRIAR